MMEGGKRKRRKRGWKKLKRVKMKKRSGERVHFASGSRSRILPHSAKHVCEVATSRTERDRDGR